MDGDRATAKQSRKRRRPPGNKVAPLPLDVRAKVISDADLQKWEKRLENIIKKSGQTQEEWEASILSGKRPRVMRREHLRGVAARFPRLRAALLGGRGSSLERSDGCSSSTLL